MTAPKTKYPIEAFGPELMQALLQGGRSQVVIPFENTPPIEGSGKRRAHTFQRRIHTLRQRMRELEHPDYRLAARAKVSLFWGPKAAEIDPARFGHLRDDVGGRHGAVIVIRPHDSEFVDVLKNAGVTAIPRLDGTSTSTEESPPFEVPASSDYDDILDVGDTPSIPSPEEEKP